MYGNRRRICGERGKALLRRRGELLERSFAHAYETGGMRCVYCVASRNAGCLFGGQLQSVYATSEVLMLSRTLCSRVKYRLNRIRSSSTGAYSIPMLLSRASRLACSMLLICAVTTFQLSAQAPTPEEQKQQAKCEADVRNAGFRLSDVPPPTEDEKKQRAQCEVDVLNSGKPADAKPPENIADATKAALACEWHDPNAVDHVLDAFYLLTTGPLIVSTRCVIQVLEKGDPYPFDEGLYSAAMGSPDEYDQPAAQGLPNFLDVLAKANTLKQKAPDDEDKLFKSTQNIIQVIFFAERGKRNLIQINDSFAHHNFYVAIRQLLQACPKKSIDKLSYEQALEQLRAAFEMNAEKLAKQIAAKIAGTKN